MNQINHSEEEERDTFMRCAKIVENKIKPVEELGPKKQLTISA